MTDKTHAAAADERHSGKLVVDWIRAWGIDDSDVPGLSDLQKRITAALQRERDRAAGYLETHCWHGSEHAWAEDSELEMLACVICGIGEDVVNGYADRIRRGEG